MARILYGKTWWGNAWVKAMERIDVNSNRLPRGKRYANAGNVTEIKIIKDQVQAKVQGTRRKPYDIVIKLKKLSNQQVETIKFAITSNPAIASELTLGRLPAELLGLLEKHQINILPTSWQDLTANCSCPDWANPCKHLAAVYYIIANEVDKNPFLLFHLRGLELIKLLETAGFSKQAAQLAQEADKDLFVPYQALSENAPAHDKAIDYAALDLSSLVSDKDTESLFTLLQENPLFYSQGNFKSILLKAYKNIAKALEKLELEENNHSLTRLKFTLLHSEGKNKKNNQHPQTQMSFFAFSGTDVPPALSGEAKIISLPEINYDDLNNKPAVELIRRKGQLLPTKIILDQLLLMPLISCQEHSTFSYRFLSTVTAVAQALAQSNAFVPRVRTCAEGNFFITYQPLARMTFVREVMDYLVSLIPAGFVFRQKDKTVLLPRDAVEELLSISLLNIVQNFAGIKEDNKICKTFFQGEYYHVQDFAEEQTGKAIADWLAWLNLQEDNISPVIKIGLSKAKPDHFTIKIMVENKTDPLAPLLPLSKIFTEEEQIFSHPAQLVRSEASRQITIAAEYFPILKNLLNFKGEKVALVNSQTMTDFLTQGQNILSLLGIRVIVPKELKELAYPKLAMRAAGKKSSGNSVSYLNLAEMLTFSWEVVLGDLTISKKEFLQLAAQTKGLVRFKDRYLMLNPEEVKALMNKLTSPLPMLSAPELLQASLTGEADGVIFNPDHILQKLTKDLVRIEEVTLPATLQASLRPYQQRGFQWLHSNAGKGLGSCLADDMGLGKTLQVIALILKLKEEGKLTEPPLIVCPTTLVGNWVKECAKFAPGLEVAVYHGSERRLNLKNSDLVITTYGVLRQDVAKFKRKDWGLLVLDEAQHIKNPTSDQTKAVKALKAGAKIAMSGTPVENRLLELWSIFDFLNPGFLGPRKDFAARFAIPIEKYRSQEKIATLKAATSPFILRRLKSDRSIIKDLPEKVIRNQYCYLSKEQAAMYQNVIDTTMEEIKTSDGIARKGLIFKLMTSLKQICNHPVHYAKKGKIIKEHSGKSEKTIALLKDILSSGEKALLFTQYKEMGDLLVKLIQHELNQEAGFFHGSLPRQKRDDLVSSFQEGKGSPILVISLKAGGTGLNLTAATNVIHYDLWWNPAVEAQATDRTYRIGQDKNVLVHRLITLGTFEEKIDEMITAKKELAELTVSVGEQSITELSNAELLEIFSLTKN